VNVKSHPNEKPPWRLACLSTALLALILALVACASNAPDVATPDTTAPPATNAVPPAAPTACVPSAVVAPTRPAETPGYTELDEATGLHITGEAVEIDPQEYRLEVTGKVDRPLSLTYDELRCMAKIERRPELVCPGFFKDVATWAGVPLADVLELAGIQPGADGLRLVGADGYSALVTTQMATSRDSFLAYQWEGEPLPVLHGFPVRAVFPGHSGSSWVKWLVRIEVLG
jgi:DMSO/TMAO reductase YedYZ molybdopterin-dependent catalytic subunit